ncbi:hypothetical protein CFC21_001953 [Triticum aestivum]|uniref:DUF4378 domain-containing protein n=1 Tax=Triticum aestivum TaxID=4565 RepID=A0A3B5Y0B5_WHEAT|nr:uncharacterized protein LOC123049527 [Triticum aestivum]KAF6983856.1 hypothetical protein CFC21_001953 [Triticum aestivum]
MAVAGVEGRPLRLKDLLELDCDSCSAAGFRCYPRHLCVPAAAPLRARHNALHEPAEAPRGLGRSPSLRHPLLSIRTLSRRLRDGFSWRRREEEEEEKAATVPAVSSSSSSDSESSESGSSTERKSESDFSASSTESLHAGAATSTACTREEDKEEAMDSGSKEADDKEQLSPVAVMDFPFDDDYEDDAVEEEEGRVGGAAACSTSFSDSLAQLHQRRNIQMHYKIRRRFGSVGEVGAVDLDETFAAASDSDGLGSVPVQQPEYFCAATALSCPEGRRSVGVCQDPDEHNLLVGTVSAVCASERLLLDFFAETRKNGTLKNFEAAARLAEDWIEGTGARWGLKEVLCGRERLVAEMDRSRRWSARLGEVEEERQIGVVVAGLLIDELVAGLVTDLLL